MLKLDLILHRPLPKGKNKKGIELMKMNQVEKS